MQADWLEKFYADDTYLDFGKAMRGGYNTPQINTLIQKANAQQMPCIIPSARKGRTVFYGLAQNGRSLDELRRGVRISKRCITQPSPGNNCCLSALLMGSCLSIFYRLPR